MLVRHDLSKKNTIVFSALHLAAMVSIVIALLYMQWHVLLFVFALLVQNLCLGVGASYHRYLVHRGYKTPKWLEYLLASCGCCALEGGPIKWGGVHREHHPKSDKDGDPHSPFDGKWWSHMDWMQHPDPLHNTETYLKKWAPDLWKDPYYQLLHRKPWLPVVVEAVVFGFFFGWGTTLQAESIAIVVGWHSTWLVNFATHWWGYRTYDTDDNSRNNWWVAILTFGEGNHNNHHAHPKSARHGERWFEWDPTYWFIWTLEQLSKPLPKRFKLVWDVVISLYQRKSL